MSGQKVRFFNLFVKESSQLSIDILKYLDKNIDVINTIGAKIKITKILNNDLDKDMVNRLAARGILRFPAMVSDDNKTFLGVKKIRNLFEGNKESYEKFVASTRQVSNAPETKAGRFNNGSLDDFYKNEMTFEAMKNDSNTGDNDEGFETGNSDDFNKRIGEQLTRRKIKNKDSDFDPTDMMAARNTTNAPRRELVDNIANSTGAAPAPKISEPRTSGGPAGAFDDSMFDRAFMENMDGGY